jgi:hypothetical protein
MEGMSPSKPVKKLGKRKLEENWVEKWRSEIIYG